MKILQLNENFFYFMKTKIDYYKWNQEFLVGLLLSNCQGSGFLQRHVEVGSPSPAIENKRKCNEKCDASQHAAVPTPMLHLVGGFTRQINRYSSSYTQKTPENVEEFLLDPYMF